MIAKLTSRRLAAALVVLLLGAPASPIPVVQAAGPVGGYESDDASDENKELAKAIKLIGLGSYASAIPLLEKAIAANPRNPDAFSLMGFSHRKLGRRNRALDYYLKALELEPEHLGANEYLGELYLETSDLARAQERLQVLEQACGTKCDEYLELKAAIADFAGETR
ncbi:tetratricopeptide repeat protein [Denitrobaculum tricleocarpae]|uniref:Tetratricopeptide repeat protein n=1 Tax=Denitrobaculum tricleocarpae TaxID=2591009 RepID=A0A545T810_9PROT|nr:tetratricopeptide repeat protein [Denitrobaculum tricleocarpae]TQV73350.1 tetratricopeptide repeat protein [Denitrobaculum tricleocarpae]